jgi:hypothetical protein
LLLDLLLQPSLSTPQGLTAAEEQLAALFALGSTQSPVDAATLFQEEVALVFDLVLASRGLAVPALGIAIDNLAAAINANPVYGTPAGYTLGLLTGALALNTFAPGV